MSEEKNEQLSKTEYEEVGEMLLELISECPHIPEELKTSGGIKYQSMDAGECIGILTMPGAKYLKKNVLGGFTAQIKFQIAYRSFPSTNKQRIDSQAMVDNIMSWLDDYRSLPGLSGGRTITGITVSNSLPYKDEVEADKSIIFAADAVMEYEAD